MPTPLLAYLDGNALADQVSGGDGHRGMVGGLCRCVQCVDQRRHCCQQLWHLCEGDCQGDCEQMSMHNRTLMRRPMTPVDSMSTSSRGTPSAVATASALATQSS